MRLIKMPKISSRSISKSSGLVSAGESDISDDHWQKIVSKEKSEKSLLEKLKVKEDKRTLVVKK